MLRRVGIGAGEEEAELSSLGVAGPYLLSVDDVLVAVLDGPALQRSEVGAGIRFAKALAPEHIALADAIQVILLLLFRAKEHEAGADPVEVHVLRAARLAVAGEGLLEDHLGPDGCVGTAVFLGPSHGEPAALADLLAELLGVLPAALAAAEHAFPPGRDLRFEEVIDLPAERLVLFAPAKLHGKPPTHLGAVDAHYSVDVREVRALAGVARGAGSTGWQPTPVGVGHSLPKVPTLVSSPNTWGCEVPSRAAWPTFAGPRLTRRAGSTGWQPTCGFGITPLSQAVRRYVPPKGGGVGSRNADSDR